MNILFIVVILFWLCFGLKLQCAHNLATAKGYCVAKFIFVFSGFFMFFTVHHLLKDFLPKKISVYFLLGEPEELLEVLPDDDDDDDLLRLTLLLLRLVLEEDRE